MTSDLKCSQIFINSFSALLQIITKFTSCAKTGWPYSIIASQLERERDRERERATERERARARSPMRSNGRAKTNAPSEHRCAYILTEISVKFGYKIRIQVYNQCYNIIIIKHKHRCNYCYKIKYVYGYKNTNIIYLPFFGISF